MVLQKELQGLAIDVRLLDQDGEEIDATAISKQNEAEERRISSSIREITSEYIVEEEEIEDMRIIGDIDRE